MEWFSSLAPYQQGCIHGAFAMVCVVTSAFFFFFVFTNKRWQKHQGFLDKLPISLLAGLFWPIIVPIVFCIFVWEESAKFLQYARRYKRSGTS